MATADYTKTAIKSYRDNHDMAQVALPKGTKDRIKNLTDESINAFINRLVIAELDRMENKSTQEPINIDKYNDMPILAPMPKPQPVMSAEDEVKALQELQKRIDGRNGNTPRINEKPSESVLEDTGEEIITTSEKESLKTDDNSVKKDFETVSDILSDMIQSDENAEEDKLSDNWLSGHIEKIEEIKNINSERTDEDGFKRLTDEQINYFVEKYGKSFVKPENKEKFVVEYGNTNYQLVVSELTFRRKIY